MNRSLHATCASRLTLVAARLFAGLTLLGVPVVAHAEEGLQLRAGAAKIEITPRTLNGLVSVWATPFEGVHDPIFARALVLGSGDQSVAIVSMDLVEIGDTQGVRGQVQKDTGIPVDHIVITASHDHNAPRSGPITPGSSSAQGRPYSTPEYVAQVDAAIVQAVHQAKAAMQPARVGVGVGSADLNINRNAYGPKRFGGPDPDGPSDKTVWVVKLESLAGQTIALLMNYAVHSTLIGPENRLVTGDFAGATERFVERRFNNKVVALWTMGPAGDQNPSFSASDGTQASGADPAVNRALVYEAMDALGLVLGNEVLRTAARIKSMATTATLRASERVFQCASQPQTPRPAGQPPQFAPNPLFKDPPVTPAELPVRLSLIRINDIALTGVSAEVFTRIYTRLKRESPLADTIMITMANDRLGYIADDAEYYGPFTNPSVQKGCAEDGIVNGLLGMLGK